MYGELNEKYLCEKEMELAEDEILLESGGYGYPPGSGGDAEGGESQEASKSHLGDLKESWEVSFFVKLSSKRYCTYFSSFSANNCLCSFTVSAINFEEMVCLNQASFVMRKQS